MTSKISNRINNWTTPQEILMTSQTVYQLSKEMDKVKILDGGAADELIIQGKKEIYEDPLWTAGLLHTDPQSILSLHKSFLKAGADVILTVSYQAFIDGFMKHLSITEDEAIRLIKKSVSLAKQACKEVALETGEKEGQVAGSVGPYGACLHDGSEYTGKYIDTVSIQEIQNWHLPRLKALSEAGVDMVAIETIPSKLEAEAVVNLIEKQFPDLKAYVTYSCRNGEETCYGEKFCDAVKAVCSSCNVIAVGVNCTGPQYINSLLKSLQGLNLQKPILVKPNSGELWKSGKGWYGKETCPDLSDCVQEWIDLGASWVGGCCRVYPSDIQKMKDKIKQKYNK